MTKRKPLIENWKVIQSKIKKYEWAQQTVTRMKQNTDWWVTHYEDNAERVMGWMHNYICDACSSSLIFDRTRPDEHVCTKCGKLRQDHLVREAWNAHYRGQSCLQVFHAAVLYQLYGEQAYVTYIRKVLHFLSDHLQQFIGNGPAGFEGKFSGINLSDAVAICNMLIGMELIKSSFSQEELAKYKACFFAPMAEFLHKKKGGTPNIACWMKSALGMAGLFFDEPKWCTWAAEGEEGINHQLQTGLLPQGFWYESSFHYHFYCAEGLTYYTAFCEIYDYSYPLLNEGIQRMYRHPLNYTFPDGRFPSPNDGWPNRSFDNYAHLYEWIRHLYDEPEYRYALSFCYQGDRTGGLPRLLFSAEEDQTYMAPTRTSRYDPDIYYVMLQHEEISVFLKYGFVIREHSHADLMNFELFANGNLLSRDISNSGYSSDIFREWQRKSIAHNTVMIDKQNQPERPAGQLLTFDEQTRSCKVAADGVYPGVRYERDMQLDENRLLDTFTVTVQDENSQTDPTEHTIDWFFHCAGELVHDLPMTPCDPPGDADGYSLMHDVHMCQIDEAWQLTWKLPTQSLVLKMEACSGTEVYIFRGYEHQADLLRWGVMVRRTGTHAQFKAEYRL